MFNHYIMCICFFQVADELVQEFSDPQKHITEAEQVGLYLQISKCTIKRVQLDS